jgi:hypothetical protein
MSFFSRKPNPAVPPAANKALNRTNGFGVTGPVGHPGVAGQASKDENAQQAPSNNRFRSFAERYIVERCRDWKEDDVDARAWEAILQARSIYNKVKEVGRTVTNDF